MALATRVRRRTPCTLIALLLLVAVPAAGQSDAARERRVPSLIRELGSANHQGRAAAARELQTVPSRYARAAVPALIATLSDDAAVELPTEDFPAYTTPGTEAMLALATIGDAAVPPLITQFGW